MKDSVHLLGTRVEVGVAEGGTGALAFDVDGATGQEATPEAEEEAEAVAA